MRFWLVLWILGLRLRWLVWRNPAFRERLKDRDIVMQWRTAQGRPARWFHFQQNRVIVRSGLCQSPTISLCFESAGYAFETLKRAGKNQVVILEGMSDGRIRIEGDAKALIWFLTVMRFVAPRRSGGYGVIS